MIARMFFLTGLIPTVALAQGSGSEAPETALGGYCPVCIVKMDKLVKGDPKYSSVYDGKKYVFPSTEQKTMFDENPTAFAPAMGGHCVVCKVEMKKDLPGKPEFHAVYNGRLYLFPSEEQLKTFKAKPEKYADADLALAGNCPVCKIELKKDVKGKPEFALDYEGQRYLFPGKEQLEKFKANPQKYTK